MTDQNFSWADFAASPRGQFIISQALAVAVENLDKVEEPHREASNISDMQGPLDNLYPMYPVSQRARSEYRAEYLKETKGA